METTVIRTAIDLDLFRIISESEKPLNADQLAETTKADPVLLARILRALGACGALAEVGNNSYSATNISRGLVIPKHAAGVRIE